MRCGISKLFMQPNWKSRIMCIKFESNKARWLHLDGGCMCLNQSPQRRRYWPHLSKASQTWNLYRVHSLTRQNEIVRLLIEQDHKFFFNSQHMRGIYQLNWIERKNTNKYSAEIYFFFFFNSVQFLWPGNQAIRNRKNKKKKKTSWLVL
jgi:hypothetical protein